MEKEVRPINGVHPEHKEFPVGKVHDVHHPEYHREAEGDEGKKKPHKDTLEKRIGN